MPAWIEGKVNYFPWHPFLMTCAFPCLMTIGRYSNATESLVEKSSRRSMHRLFMILGSLTACCGYYCIYKAHLPKKQFFGYDFIHKQWSTRARVAHDWCGYITIALLLMQVPLGIIKLEYAKTGSKVLRIHGLLGNLILSTGATAILTAIYFWTWTDSFKLTFALALLLTLIVGVFWPPCNKAGEARPLVSKVSKPQTA